jgi:FdrA protein
VSWHVQVIANRYADSVRLMSISRSVRGRDGVRRCELGMGTPANIEFLAALGARADASPADVVIAVDADDGDAAPALAFAERELASLQPRNGGFADLRARPRSLALAARELPDANVALISVPGEYAALEAHQALSAGMHVFLFSDHVPLAAEVELKQRAAGLGLLVMGPECGTAMLGGIGLGFANVVSPGRVGIVAAAGTGAQECACLLDAAGVGVSQIVGVGGRDLSSEVGGIMFRQGMRMLAADEDTETLLLVSKSPSADAVDSVAEAVPADKRVVAAFLGWDRGEAPFEIHPTLESGAAAAARVVPSDLAPIERELDARARQRPPGSLLGLYSGGSLAHEAATILEPALGPLAGNVGHGPPDPSPDLRDGLPDGGSGSDSGGAHRLLDLGEEQYTQGRPHPMVDLGTRVAMLERAANDDRVGCVLLDVVLGHSGHPDPAGGLADALARVAARRLVIAHVCGTPDDPQDSRRQAQTLADAGALVAPTNAAAARLALRALR